LIVGSGPTTGLIVSEDGYILSSAFNFVQQAASVVVTLPNGEKKAARVVARDRSRMLVLLKVDAAEPLTAAVAVPHEQMRVGQWALAVGRTFDASQPNVSVGILSAANRIWSKAIQTDAKVSPANYGGPLIDIQGRVLGILVPLSPQQHNEIAGAEWYDSGIGFAIPLADLAEPIERLKQGTDLYRGILGITLKGTNIFADPAVVATSVSNSPAAKAGLKPGDRVIEIDGQPVERQTHLKHVLGPKYAGETVHIVVRRGDQELAFDIELADRVDPYERPYLGILPARDSDDEASGVGVRYVLRQSPAQAAEIRAGDRIMGVAGDEVADSDVLRELLAVHEPGQTVVLGISRDDEQLEVTVELGAEPSEVPDTLPLRHETDDEKPAEVVSIKLAEEANDCFALIPASYTADSPHGVIIWLSAPNPFDKDEFVGRWGKLCAQHELIVLAPQPNNEQRWQITELAIVSKLFNELDRQYELDLQRVAVHGYQGGASLAYRFAFEDRRIVHGVAIVDASIPMRVQLRGNDPVEHLAFWIHAGKDSRRAQRVRRDVSRLQEMKFPVTANVVDGKSRYLNEAELSELARWVDILDRI
jgi:serine protease Do